MPTRPPVHRPPGWQPPEVRQAAYDRARAPQQAKDYGPDWRKVRKAFLAANPMCVCGCGQRATQVDHIVSVRERPDLRLVWSNLRALCASCHSRRTATDQGWGAAARDRLDR
jgi:5-methylcytosine-specific restriction endonuclease McrA